MTITCHTLPFLKKKKLDCINAEAILTKAMVEDDQSFEDGQTFESPTIVIKPRCYQLYP